MAVTQWIINARSGTGEPIEVEVDPTTGLILTVASPGQSSRSEHGMNHIDLAGDLLLQAAVEPHAHLDKVLTAHLVPNPKGDLLGAIEGWMSFYPSLTVADMVSRATDAVGELVASGITAIRTHVNVHEGIDLKAMEALLQVRADNASRCDIQLVSLTGWVGGDNQTNRRLLRDSVLMDPSVVVGGCPHLDIDSREATDIALELAGSEGRALDLHTDENLEPHSEDLRYLAERIIATGYRGVAAASHCCSLGVQDPGRQRETADMVAAAGIAVIALPQTNLFLQSRDMPQAPPRGLTAVHALREAGVTVAAGADNVRDPFNSMGRHDPCETAALMVMAGHLLPDAAWDAVTRQSRRAIGLTEGGIAPGQPADLVSLRGADLASAIARAEQHRRVWKNGRIVSETVVQQRILAP
jgi:cytosine/creatinine deaminase